jgi:hypothetical protein
MGLLQGLVWLCAVAEILCKSWHYQFSLLVAKFNRHFITNLLSLSKHEFDVRFLSRIFCEIQLTTRYVIIILGFILGFPVTTFFPFFKFYMNLGIALQYMFFLEIIQEMDLVIFR